MKIKRITLIVTAIAFFSLLATQPINAMDNSLSSSASTACIETYHLQAHSEISSFEIQTGWKYKIVNGVLYKRLYDYTNRKWIGDWIRA